MSWGWTPICQTGADRYRISERPTAPSLVIGASPCGIMQSQLPSDTTVSVVLPTTQPGTVTTQLSLHPLGTQLSSFTSRSSNTSSSNQSQSLPVEERSVRRSPRLAQNPRSNYRVENESQLNRGRNQWNTPRPPDCNLWNTSRNQTNNSLLANKNYSIYNFEGHVNPTTIVNNSVSVVYSHSKNINMTHSRLHPAPISLSSRTGGNIITTAKAPAKKVTIKNLAFYNVVMSLVEMEILHEEVGPIQRVFRFQLDNETLKQMKNKDRKHPYQIQLRLCKLDSSSEQNDYYPVTHQILINNQQILLPGLETMPRGYTRPMDITHFCQLSHSVTNFLMVRCWESCKVFVRIVEKFTSQDLLERLEKRNLIKEEDTTKEIKKKLEVDQSEEEIASTTLQCSLTCPLSRTRMKLPCRASTCNHLQCFDAATYLQLNECKAKWSCPVCYQPAHFEHLLIDGYFKKVIDEQPNIDKVELHPDGSWTSVEPVKKKSQPEPESVITQNNEEDSKAPDEAEKTMVVIDSDDEDITENSKADGQNENHKDNAVTVVPLVRQSDSSEIETIVLSDDDSPTEEIPIVSTVPFTPSTTTPLTSVNSTLDNTVDLGTEQLAYILGSRINSLFGNYQPLNPYDHSSANIYPFGRTPTQYTTSALTITPISGTITDNGIYNSSHISQDNSKTQKISSKSKSKKARKRNHSTSSRNASPKKSKSKNKRRRIVSESSSESSRSSNLLKKGSKKKDNHKGSKSKQNRQNSRRVSESSESEKSSKSSSSSNSVNLISDSDSSSSSSSSSSSDSSDNEASDHSDDSFVAGKIVDIKNRTMALRPRNKKADTSKVQRNRPEKGKNCVKDQGEVKLTESSTRVLRSQAVKRKKKKSH